MVIRAFVAVHRGFTIMPDERTVRFISGKLFWVWDISSLETFIRGTVYGRWASPAATVPAQGPPSAPTVPMVQVSVPALVAARMLPIALSLFDQMVLSKVCGYSFPTMTAAVFRCKGLLPAKVFQSLLVRAAAATAARGP